MTQPALTLEPKPELPPRISISDEQDLVWYFGYGQTLFFSSTCGDMLERAHAYRYGARRCRKCSGEGFLHTDLSTCDKCDGMGFIPRNHRSTKLQDITARPSQNARHEATYEPRDDDLTRFAKVGRRVDAAIDASPEAGRVLASYYGDCGTHWDVSGRGRIFALYSMTDSGARLLKHSQKRSQAAIRLHASQTLNSEAECQIAQPNRRRRELLDAAKIEALALYRRAVVVWNEVR